MYNLIVPECDSETAPFHSSIIAGHTRGAAFVTVHQAEESKRARASSYAGPVAPLLGRTQTWATSTGHLSCSTPQEAISTRVSLMLTVALADTRSSPDSPSKNPCKSSSNPPDSSKYHHPADSTTCRSGTE
ncbi:hypothetical protein CC80DRAFT_508099 [Byssothecium circinans]|uniref:Uncharacterized protein n=1 Tax=Byssothecium circinans TaxID=147558 RepID=A0A6A5THV3_9PLEO|nr:hypothetical protein CC80DRAFT_508099 [Byssothecium circinans]